MQKRVSQYSRLCILAVVNSCHPLVVSQFEIWAIDQATCIPSEAELLGGSEHGIGDQVRIGHLDLLQ